MKKLILSAMLGTLFSLTSYNVQADNPPYIDSVYIGSSYGSSFYGASYPSDTVLYHNYQITATLDYPQPYVDEMQWWAINTNSWYTVATGDVTWPSPSGTPLLSESWNGSQHILELRAIMRNADTPSYTQVDNSYYFTYDGNTIYSSFCHGCVQANGGIHIYNP